MLLKLQHYETKEIKIIGEEEDLQYWRDNGYALIERIPENIEEEDILNGHPYPGHECWNDEYDY